MGYKLDFKVTEWRRITLENEAQMLEVKAKLENKEYFRVSEICDELNVSADVIYDTEEEINVDENQGNPTIEILNEDGNTIWANAKINLKKK